MALGGPSPQALVGFIVLFLTIPLGLPKARQLIGEHRDISQDLAAPKAVQTTRKGEEGREERRKENGFCPCAERSNYRLEPPFSSAEGTFNCFLEIITKHCAVPKG